VIPLVTDRLILRQFKLSDWLPLHKMIVQYSSTENARYDQQWPTSPEEIKGVAEWFASGENFLAVTLKENALFIGFVALNPEGEGSLEFNLGYVFDAHYHGQGYAAEACQAVLRRAFRLLHAQRVITGTAAANRPSCRLLERLGFQKTGESMGSLQSGSDGKPIEFLGYQYALTAQEWEKALESE